MNDVKKLVIDRSKWYRAKEGSGSALVRKIDGKMCCLGFYGCALGGDPGKTRLGYASAGEGDAANGMLGSGYPREGQEFWPKWLFEGAPNPIHSQDATWYQRLARINDRTGDEQEIARIFAEHGVEVEFVDGETEEKQP